MPARSERQRRLLNARFGHDWVKRHHFDNEGKLPERSAHGARSARARKRRRGSRREKMVTQFMRKHGGSRGRQR
jgi:hypothetical protein